MPSFARAPRCKTRLWQESNKSEAKAPPVGPEWLYEVTRDWLKIKAATWRADKPRTLGTI